MIEFANVTYSYDGAKNALDGISLTLAEGEFVGILGGNGSGKSTLAKHLNGLLTPASGSVTAFGYDTKDEEHVYDIRANVGMVFQNPDDQLVASLVENEVAFGPENLRLESAEIRQRVTDALAACGLQGFEKRETASLSGGQKQRVAIAGALAMKPRILVLDEAAAMLDPLGRAGLMRVVERLHASGMAILMITHSMEEASLCQRIIVMKEGCIIADGPSRSILTNAALMEEAGLELPFASQLSRDLQAAGIPMTPCLTESECEEALCNLF